MNRKFFQTRFYLGFSLVEILVVITIIGILTYLVSRVALTAREKAMIRGVSSDVTVLINDGRTWNNTHPAGGLTIAAICYDSNVCNNDPIKQKNSFGITYTIPSSGNTLNVLAPSGHEDVLLKIADSLAAYNPTKVTSSSSGGQFQFSVPLTGSGG